MAPRGNISLCHKGIAVCFVWNLLRKLSFRGRPGICVLFSIRGWGLQHRNSEPTMQTPQGPLIPSTY